MKAQIRNSPNQSFALSSARRGRPRKVERNCQLCKVVDNHMFSGSTDCNRIRILRDCNRYNTRSFQWPRRNFRPVITLQKHDDADKNTLMLAISNIQMQKRLTFVHSQSFRTHGMNRYQFQKPHDPSQRTMSFPNVHLPNLKHP